MEFLSQIAAFLAVHPWQMWATLIIIGGAIFGYASDRFDLEIVSLTSVVALLILFALFPLLDASGADRVSTENLLAGFANPSLIAVICLLILGRGIFQAGTMEYPTRMIIHALRIQKTLVVVFVFFLVLTVSAFLNDTPVVVMFLPIVAALAAESGIPPSRLMMPLSFIALFGGMTTLIGSSTNILAAGVFEDVSGQKMGFFDMTPLGLVIAATGILYLATIGRALLPRRTEDKREAERENKQFIAQFEVTRGHSLIGAGPVAGLFPDLPDVTVRMVQRREDAILPPFDDFKFKVGDTVIVAATRQALMALLKSRPEIIGGALSETSLEDEGGAPARAQLTLVEALVAPASRMIGRTIGQIGFHYQTNCVILGVERRSRMIRTQMSAIRLEAGDVLLILGPLEDVRGLRTERDLLLLEWSMEGIIDPRNAIAAGLIFVSVVATAATGVAPIEIAALAGVLLMLLFGCLNIRQAARAFDRRIYMLIGASLAMGLAIEATGAAALLGAAIAPIADHFGPAVLISTVFIISAATTNLLSNNATAVLFVPIAVNAARIAGMDPMPLALTVIYGANCPFLTPIGYQTNLLVMGPGHYKFSDYLRVGGPLLLLIWFLYSIAAPLWFERQGML
jgi:di/tricarboxylate transporter